MSEEERVTSKCVTSKWAWPALRYQVVGIKRDAESPAAFAPYLVHLTDGDGHEAVLPVSVKRAEWFAHKLFEWVDFTPSPTDIGKVL